jgi:hypothetical protein
VARLSGLVFSILIASTLFLGVSLGSAQSNPTSEKHETPAALPANGANQNNQSALYAALIEALHAVTEQEKATAKQARAENEALISPAHVQEGLLFVGFLYSFLAWLQWNAIKETARIANRAERPWVTVQEINLKKPLEFPPTKRFFAYFHIAVKNTGRSIALNVVAMAFAIPGAGDDIRRKGEEARRLCLDSRRNTEWPIGLVLAPGDSAPMPMGTGSDDITADHLARQRTFFIAGCVTYDDQEGMPHRTTFCFTLASAFDGSPEVAFIKFPGWEAD